MPLHQDDLAQDVRRGRAQSLAGGVDALLGQVTVRTVDVKRQKDPPSSRPLGTANHRRQEQRDILVLHMIHRIKSYDTNYKSHTPGRAAAAENRKGVF